MCHIRYDFPRLEALICNFHRSATRHRRPYAVETADQATTEKRLTEGRHIKVIEQILTLGPKSSSLGEDLVHDNHDPESYMQCYPSPIMQTPTVLTNILIQRQL